MLFLIRSDSVFVQHGVSAEVIEVPSPLLDKNIMLPEHAYGNIALENTMFLDDRIPSIPIFVVKYQAVFDIF